MDRIQAALINAQQAYQWWSSTWPTIKTMMIAGHRLHVEIKPEKRSTAQNRMLHARISDIAKHIEWAGKRRDVDIWKRLLTAAWLRARGESIELLPAIDGHGVDVVFRRTSSLSISECAELSDYVMAYGDAEGVPWCTASIGRDWPDAETP